MNITSRYRLQVGRFKSVTFNKYDIDRFNSKVKKTDECWIWMGSRGDKSGYGIFGMGKVGINSHRVSYVIHKGEIPDGMHVLHKCDNRLCVNPDHLWIGTHTDNMQDKIKKGRANCASGNNHASRRACNFLLTLTKDLLIKIRKEYSSGVTQVYLASKYKVSHQIINFITVGEVWKQLNV